MTNYLRRREFITLLGGAAAAWPLAARAQQGGRVRRIDVLMGLIQGDADAQPRITAFEQALYMQPWSKEHKLQIVYHWGASDAERAGSLAKEVVEQRPDVIVAHTTPAVVAIQHETRTIPLVFVQVTDPVAAGLVASLARPGGNATGFTNFDASLGGKWLGLLKEIAPRTERVALLYNPEAAPFASYYLNSFEAVALRLSVQPIATPVRNDNEIEGVMTSMEREPGGGLIVVPDIFTTNHRQAIISLAAHHRVLSVYPFRYWAVDGGLVSYGIDPVAPFRQAAVYVDRILRGEKASDLPVQQPVRFEFVINLKTAKALGLTIPETLLATADELIE